MRRRPGALSRSRLQRMIEAATVDAYNDEEQATGFLTMIQDHLPCPFTALVVGEPVRVMGFDFGEPYETTVMAVCRRNKRYKTNVTSLEWEGRAPPGAEWIEAYRAWLRGS
ncbi:MAG: hypothetical protein HYZ89_05115 [Candidatus Omnitrophica bacterium]|nr:hypothetical protein [Candidatus Omnitrophota bacterium]